MFDKHSLYADHPDSLDGDIVSAVSNNRITHTVVSSYREAYP